MSEPTIIMGGDVGHHNSDLLASAKRLQRGKMYRNLNTVFVLPTRGTIPAQTVEALMGLIPPMNHLFVRLFIRGLEVAEAYNQAVELILNHEVLKDFKYLLTVEEDNIPPPDGLLKLYESIDDYAAVGGLYWTKGEGGQPMIYGDPKGVLGFQPQLPELETVQECNGLGQGFTLFNLDLFRDEKIPRPWFKTVSEWSKEKGASMGTQDLYFFANARKAGYRVACDTRVRVGHLDVGTDVVW